MSDIEDRLLELERRATRILPAREGADGWANFVESRVQEESEFLRDVVAHALAGFRNDLIDECKVLIQQALVQRVRGTFSEKETYAANDVVAPNGASFIARRDNPGACPGPHWQMVAAQGRRGAIGPRGERGEAAPKLEKWIVDRSTLTATPVYSGGIFGPTLDLSELFSQSPSETT